MSIPLERLYNYIENIANNIHGGRVLIYRFWPHGSKNINNLTALSNCTRWFDVVQCPEIYCNDQEPLDWNFYQKSKRVNTDIPLEEAKNEGLVWEVLNFRRQSGSIWDKALVLHSEKNSVDVELYRQSRFIPVYYWTHAVLAKDWFRYAEHVDFKKIKTDHTFLIYNRAWSGTREYRLKFCDLLIDNQLISHCRSWANTIDPELEIPYKIHKFHDDQWKPKNDLEKFFQATKADSNSSADFEIQDYESTEFEVVLETLFATEKIHLTEKTLRPIALGHPFLLCSAAGSLKYLKDYGFKTFDSVFDESYDDITDHKQRLESVVNTMKQIVNWNIDQRHCNMKKIKAITDYNQKYFLSNDFSDLIINELTHNLTQGLEELKNTNTSQYYLNYRLQTRNNPKILNLYQSIRTEQEAFDIFKLAEYYYQRSLSQK
jgi:hypothetical protein